MDEEALGLLTRIDSELALLPLSQTSSFAEARASKTLKPETVVAESNPTIFHRYYQNNTAKAASQLASFWQVRHALFGEKAFEPLFEEATKRNFGDAVTEGDVEAIDRGHVQVLVPDNTANRHFLFFNSQVPPPSSLTTLKRISFLAIQSLMAHLRNISERSAEIILLISTGQNLNSLSVELLQWICGFIVNSVPLTLRRLHFVKTKKDPLSSDALAFINHVMQADIAEEVVVTNSQEGGEFISKLSYYSLAKATLPAALGGDMRWEANNLVDIALQQKKRKAASATDASDANSLPRSTSWHSHSLGDISETPTEHGVSSEDTRQSAMGPNRGLISGSDEVSASERPRTKNAIYSRRKYIRKKIELEVLENECKRLKSSNAALKQEGRRLEDLRYRALEEAHKHSALPSNLSTNTNGRVGMHFPTAHGGGFPHVNPQLWSGQNVLNDTSLLMAQVQSNVMPFLSPNSAGVLLPQQHLFGQAALPNAATSLALQGLGQIQHFGGSLALPQAPVGGSIHGLPDNFSSSLMAAPSPAPSSLPGNPIVNTVEGLMGRHPTQEEIQRFLQGRLRRDESKSS